MLFPCETSRRVWSLGIIAVGWALGLGGCRGALRGPWPSTYQRAGEYRIGPGDILRVNVWQNQELSSRVTVRPDGAITLPLIDEVPVAGKTVTEANRVINDRYRRFIAAENHVTLMVEEIHSYRVYVLGKVAHPGEFESRTPVTVLQALALAGGPMRTADTGGIVVLHREDNGAERRYLFSYDEATAGRLVMNFVLGTGDTVVVP
jgi:polysaccharide biosynthesis/export protein